MGAGRGAGETADRRESVWKEEASVVWKLQGFQPLPPKPEQSVHLPLPTHPASCLASPHQGRSATVPAWHNHSAQAPALPRSSERPLSSQPPIPQLLPKDQLFQRPWPARTTQQPTEAVSIHLRILLSGYPHCGVYGPGPEEYLSPLVSQVTCELGGPMWHTSTWKSWSDCLAPPGTRDLNSSSLSCPVTRAR